MNNRMNTMELHVKSVSKCEFGNCDRDAMHVVIYRQFGNRIPIVACNKHFAHIALNMREATIEKHALLFIDK